MRNFWVMADPHLGHKRMIECGFRKPGFEKRIINSIKKMVRPGDVLICLGDVAFSEVSAWHKRLCELPGTKWMIRGNHDDKSSNWYLDRGWDFIAESAMIKLNGVKALLTHVPAIKPAEPIMSFHMPDINLHGHMHGQMFGSHPGDPEHIPGWHYEIHMEHTLAPVNLRFVLECISAGRDYGCGPKVE